MRKIVCMLLCAVLLCGCADPKGQKRESQLENESETNKSDEELGEQKKQEEEERETLDDFEYTYNENTNVFLHLFETNGKKKLMTTITCNNSDWNFACLCYMQSAITLASMNKEVDYIIILDNEGNSFGELREEGKIQKITEPFDFENISPSDEETEKSIEYSEQLDEFIESNNLK